MSKGIADEVKLERQYAVWLIVILVASVSGYFLALRRTPEAARQARILAAPEPDAVNGAPDSDARLQRAPSYLELAAREMGPNRDFHPQLTGLQTFQLDSEQLRALAADFEPPTQAEREALRQRRTERRAFAGAPPVVPHPIHERDSQNCLVCHAETVRIGTLIAPGMSHQFLSQCTQCHIENAGTPEFRQDGPQMSAASAAVRVDNRFVGLPPPLQGERAGPGAPPTIPHPTWMQSVCISCHHPAGSSPLRTSHPWRQNCTQCHAPSAELDQFPRSLDLAPSHPPAARLNENAAPDQSARERTAQVE